MDAQVVEAPFDWQEQYAISQAHRVGHLVFTSGQAAIAPDGTVVGAGDLRAQIEQTMTNLAAVLEAAGSSLERVFKVTIYVTDMAGFPDIVDMRRRWFKAPWPSDTIVQVAALGLPELLVEIEAVATVDEA
ncbi:RidA family protein [Capillimicrobium parvum]|uniref:2-iminobutanoate/2-iminopropanoate deaminase n=1 Tax=Capillimicrobium parvum TaxID=2884022 RepID=A0A9E7C321_9ACTN|nr:RidA family protein [Capillimicrobium parvum]UGS39136.1 2-iminobutanoate/2-iminopropanoate deaminase [Capillimicrobium parvum]